MTDAKCDARIDGRRCRRVAIGKLYESGLSASGPGWSLVTKHRFCRRCGALFLSVSARVERLLKEWS